MRWTCCHNIFRLELFGVTNLMHGSPRKAHDRLGDGTRISRGPLLASDWSAGRIEAADWLMRGQSAA